MSKWLKKSQLSPQHVAVIVGQKLVIEFSEQERYSLKFGSRNQEEYGVTLPPPKQKLEKIFQKPESHMVIRCDVHSGLVGHLTVVPNKHFTRTDGVGAYSLRIDLPPGTYGLCCFHPGHGILNCKFTVNKGDQALTLDLIYREKK